MSSLRHAFRRLLASPGFTVTALVTLALGIGVNTSMFTVLSQFVLRQLPYADGERLVSVYRTSPQNQSWPHSPANFLDYQAQNAVFEKMAAIQWTSYNLAEPGQAAERLRGLAVTGDFFAILGVPAALGRSFGPAEDKPGQPLIVVLSHPTWVSRFARDPGVIGRTVRMNGDPVTIVGVMPPGFEERILWGHVDVWQPRAFTDQERGVRGSNYLTAIAKLKPGTSLKQAQAAMTTLAARFAQAYPQNNAQNGIRLVRFGPANHDDMGRRLTWLLVGLGGFVLLIACANLAHLQFARTASRAREYAIRTALGASRFQLIRDVLTESVLLGVLGGLLGLVVAVWSNDVLSREIVINQSSLPLPLDLRVLAFAFVASVGSGLGFGLLPALLASRTQVGDALKQGSRGTSASPAQHRLRHALIVAEVALALVLLSGAGFFIRGLQRFAQRDLGWKPDGLLTGYIALPANKYNDAAKRRAFADQFREKLAALPGVERSTIANTLPTSGIGSSSNLIVEGRPAPERGREPLFRVCTVAPDYFETLGLGLVAGRTFNAGDRADGPLAIVISETTARTLWPGESALGKRIGSPGDTPNWREVVGVVKDFRAPADFGTPDTPFMVYRSLTQTPSGYLTFALRTSVAPEALANEVRRAVATIDPDQPVHDIGTVRSEIEREMDNFGVVSWLLGGFSLLGVVLAGVGIYGVITGFVVQRTNEIGIRVALGAQIRDILALVLGKGLRLVALGVLLGLGGAYAIARLLTSIVPEVPAAESYTAFVITALLVGIATFACWLPARRATKVDPMTALRSE